MVGVVFVVEYSRKTTQTLEEATEVGCSPNVVFIDTWGINPDSGSE